jgi:hypothetical protein
MTKKIILITDFKESYFNYLVECYDKEFKRRLIKQLTEIKTHYTNIKDLITKDNLKIVKADYLYIDDIIKY